ncbi:hypothetical protein DSO57_1039733 [Entomophthora muscae]|uniref:Uncharacterized protein n=2 Tax=Entomophthora muscae TaxID=34485 RepID=A0ACC2SKS3_9FUNG|nr:hypothetical protein DSO57_1004918 [Entomophthora muscae]KAJ9075490.1 hypothetical protein DSO57_1039733 [Entomophthora muscae]
MNTVPINQRYCIVVKDGSSPDSTPLKRALSVNSSIASSATLSRNSSQSSQRLAVHCGHSKNYDLTFVPMNQPSPRRKNIQSEQSLPPLPSLRNPMFDVAGTSKYKDSLPSILEVDPSRVGGAMDIITGSLQEGLGKFFFSDTLCQSGRRKKNEGKARISAAKHIKLSHF